MCWRAAGEVGEGLQGLHQVALLVEVLDGGGGRGRVGTGGLV